MVGSLDSVVKSLLVRAMIPSPPLVDSVGKVLLTFYLNCYQKIYY